MTTSLAATLPERAPRVGELVHVRSRRWLVEEVVDAADPGGSPRVRLACADHDAPGQSLEVFWNYEPDRQIVAAENWADLGSRGFDPPRRFAAFLHTLRWHCTTATDPRLFQSPFRAGIRIDAYQMEPLHKALRLPRVNLFIADDTGLGKTIKAGLIARELLLRRKVNAIVVAAPPSVLEQWKSELEERFGLVFEQLDRAYFSRMRRERGFGVNPWRTHSRFLVSHNLLVDPAYADPLREWLGPMRPGSLLIVDEAHHAAPSSGGRYGIETKLTRAVRDLGGRFEHRLFLSATPHNGHSNSFSTLLELLDPYRFTRGVRVRGRRELDDVMVRRLKEDVRQLQDGFPRRVVERIEIAGLPDDAPELVLSRLLDEYRGAREQRHRDASGRARAAAGLLVVGLQQRLLSSIEAFARSLTVHRATVERQWRATASDAAADRGPQVGGRDGTDAEDGHASDPADRGPQADGRDAADDDGRPADGTDRGLPFGGSDGADAEDGHAPDRGPQAHGSGAADDDSGSAPDGPADRGLPFSGPRTATPPTGEEPDDPFLTPPDADDERGGWEDGDQLVEAWRAHGGRPDDTAGEDDVTAARRLVAQRCLYGVDRNPVAVDLAKLSLWLATLAKDESFTFLDHALRHGDSLVGLSRRQIAAFHWKANAPEFQPGFEALQGAEHLARAAALRRRIRDARPTVTDRELHDLWDEARFEADNVRLLGDLTLAAFFEGGKPKQREEHRRRFADAVHRGEMAQHRNWMAVRRGGDPPLAPFHWEIEFQEVFERENPGFDAVVGNPPFLGGKRISTVLGGAYRDWLADLHDDSSSNADLVAHFFRRAFTLLRYRGTFGLIATNTIAQGDTRSTGLRWICTHGADIYQAQRRRPWPGQAAVVVSVLHVHKGPFTGVRLLDDARTDRITAFLFHRGGHDDPARLRVNGGKSFVGSYVLGMGFTFDDTDTKGVASSLADKQRLIEENSRNGEAIFPYIGGEEVNTSPTHAHHRFVINFPDYPLRREDLGDRPGDRPASTRRDIAGSAGRPASAAATWVGATDEQHRAWLRNGIVPLDYPGPVAADWPKLLAIVEERVKPERDVQNRKILRERWWQYADKRPGLYSTVAGLDRVLANSQVSQRVQFAFLPANMVYAHTLNVFPFAIFAALCILQSRPHDLWARFFASSLEDRLRYTPSDCFETFPFPDAWETRSDLESAGEHYHDFRADLMARRGEGLTRTYNRFHDPNETESDIATLRRLHAAMDRAVLDAYGWPDIPTDYEFLLDYEIDEDEWGARKKPYRYRWPDDIRDEVLARLLELNTDRAAEEARAGTAAPAARPETARTPNRPARRPTHAETRPLWGSPMTEDHQEDTP